MAFALCESHDFIKFHFWKTTMKAKEEILTKERLYFVREKRNAAREAAYAEIKDTIGDAALAEMRKLYDMFDEKIYIWLAGLWDGERGAFYYSESARDTHLYLPDIESTAQILKFLNVSGMLRRTEGEPIMRIPESMRNAIINFAHSLQDPDGYFYHEQWGKNISVSRRGRDLCWAKNILAEAGEATKYPLPTKKSADGKKSASLPEYLQDIEAFKAYLGEMDLSQNSYYIGNIIESTMSQISAAGKEFEDYLAEWLNSQNRTDNGLWEEKICYASVNGLMKMAGNYPHMKIPLPNAKQSLSSAIAAAMSDERMTFVCEVYNPWAAIGSIFRASKHSESPEELDELRTNLVDNAPSLIAKTRDKISVFRKNDGSYSYFKTMSCAVSQRAPAAVPRTNEGDVNATTICVGSTVRSMREALRIPVIPIFTPEDGDLFFELIDNAPKITKKFYIGDTFPEKPTAEEEMA